MPLAWQQMGIVTDSTLTVNVKMEVYDSKIWTEAQKKRKWIWQTTPVNAMRNIMDSDHWDKERVLWDMNKGGSFLEARKSLLNWSNKWDDLGEKNDKRPLKM